MNEQQRMSRTIGWSVAILAALIVAVGVAIVIALSAMTAAQQEADYRACVAASGLYETSSPDEMVAIADRCYSGVYDTETK